MLWEPEGLLQNFVACVTQPPNHFAAAGKRVMGFRQLQRSLKCTAIDANDHLVLVRSMWNTVVVTRAHIGAKHTKNGINTNQKSAPLGLQPCGRPTYIKIYIIYNASSAANLPIAALRARRWWGFCFLAFRCSGKHSPVSFMPMEINL
jgi:hypothetical protein